MWKPLGVRTGVADLARLHLGHEFEDELRQLGAFAPAELAAVEGGLAVRVRDGELAEILALGGAGGDVVGLLGDLLELLRGGGLGQRQEDVGDVEFIVRRLRSAGGPGTVRARAARR